MNRQELADKLTPIMERYPVKTAALFGSRARQEHSAESDVDVLVDFSIDSPGLMFYSLKEALVEELGFPVDLVYYKGLAYTPPDFRESVERDAVVFYAKNTD